MVYASTRSGHCWYAVRSQLVGLPGWARRPPVPVSRAGRAYRQSPSCVCCLQGRRDDEMLEVFARSLIEDIGRSTVGGDKGLLLAIALDSRVGGGAAQQRLAFRSLLPFVLQHKPW